MTDSVRDVAQGRSLHLLQQKQKRELEHLAARHERDVAAAKSVHQRDLAELRESNIHEVAQEVEKKEQVLGALRESIEKTRDISAAEVRRIQGLGAQQRAQVVAASDAERQQFIDRHQEHITELTGKHNTALRDQAELGNQTLQELSETQRRQVQEHKQRATHELHQQRARFTHQQRSEGEKFETLTQRRQLEQKKVLAQRIQQHDQRLNDLRENHRNLSDRVAEDNQRRLREQEAFFEGKFQTQMAAHLKNEQHQGLLAEKGLAKIKEEFAPRTKFFADRRDDPFFRFTELDVEVQAHPAHYEIRVPIPEYAKEELTLTAKAKELVLTVNRRFEDVRDAGHGGVAKVHKVESLVKRLTVDQVLDPRKVSRSWSDGVAIFTVAKA